MDVSRDSTDRIFLEKLRKRSLEVLDSKQKSDPMIRASQRILIYLLLSSYGCQD